LLFLFYLFSPFLNTIILGLFSKFYFVKENYILLDNGFKAYISNACNGYFLYALLASILVYLNKSFIYIVINIIVLFIFNLIRIYLILKLVTIDINFFEIAHDLIGRVLMVIVFLSLVYVAKKEKNLF